MKIILENEEIRIEVSEYAKKVLKDCSGNNKQMLEYLRNWLELTLIDSKIAIGESKKIENFINCRIDLIKRWRLLFELEYSIINNLYENFKIRSLEEVGLDNMALDKLLYFIFKSINLNYEDFKG